MYRLTNGEVNYLELALSDTLDLLRNGEDGDTDKEELIFRIEDALELIGSLNYHSTEEELDIIQEEQDSDNAV